MTNLGSDTTPIKGQNFELPAGAQLDEESGDLVIRDSGGSIVFRRDETNGRWDLEGEDLFNGSQQVYDATNDELTANVNNDSVNTGNVSLDDVAGDGLPAQAIEHGKAWADDGNLYGSLQAAIDNGSTVVLVGPGLFSEQLFNIPENMLLAGSGRETVIDGTSGTAIELTNTASIQNMAFKTNNSDGGRTVNVASGADESNITNIWVEESGGFGINVGANGCRIVSVWCDSDNIPQDDVRLTGDGNIADDIIGAVNDGGTGNSVGETA